MAHGLHFLFLDLSYNPCTKEQAMADYVAERMSRSSTTTPTVSPKKGERVRCSICGMEIKVTADCRCQDAEGAHFQCCGQATAQS